MTTITAPELVVFSGLQGSGKTSFYRERFATTHVHVSKDNWPNARKKEARQRRLVTELLSAGRSAVVDNTNPTPDERGPLVDIAKALGIVVSSYTFLTSIEVAIHRNETREGRARVDPIGIYAVAKKWITPGPEEGFDHRFTVELIDGQFVLVAL